MQVCSRIYYEKSTGKIVKITDEWDGGLPFNEEKIMKDYDLSTLNYIELQFGELVNTVQNIVWVNGVPQGYVDLETGALHLEHYEYSEEEPVEEKRPPTTLERVDQLEKENKDLKETILELSSMVLGGLEYEE